jgi:hypothetical protein
LSKLLLLEQRHLGCISSNEGTNMLHCWQQHRPIGSPCLAPNQPYRPIKLHFCSWVAERPLQPHLHCAGVSGRATGRSSTGRKAQEQEDEVDDEEDDEEEEEEEGPEQQTAAEEEVAAMLHDHQQAHDADPAAAAAAAAAADEAELQQWLEGEKSGDFLSTPISCGTKRHSVHQRCVGYM